MTNVGPTSMNSNTGLIYIHHNTQFKNFRFFSPTSSRTENISLFSQLLNIVREIKPLWMLRLLLLFFFFKHEKDEKTRKQKGNKAPTIIFIFHSYITLEPENNNFQ